MKSRFKKKQLLLIIVAIILMACISSCKKLIDIDAPPTNLSSGNVYKEDATAISVLTGLYIQISSTSYTYEASGLPSISKLAGLSADEFTLWSGATLQMQAYYSNNLVMGQGVASFGGELWPILFGQIYTCNSAIEGLTSSESLTQRVKLQLLGEAKFMRAFIYLYLANLYGDIPIITGTDYEINRLLPRAPKAQVYQLIINDLKEAKELLSDKYLDVRLNSYTNQATAERTRPTKWAAEALLARAYLYTGDYAKIEDETSALINNSSVFSLQPLNSVFLSNSKETIWQIQPVIQDWNTEDARMFILSVAPIGPSVYKNVYLSRSLLSAFEPGDKRRTDWVGAYTSGSDTFYFPYKYKSATAAAPVTEYLTILRLAEQYLIRSEARAQQENISGAVADLNLIRTRSRAVPTVSIPNPLPDLLATLSKIQVLIAVLQERRVELFSEWGHRWLDLKRTGQVDQVMSIETPLKGGAWQTTQQLYPIPLNDILRNPSLTQNQGYK